MQRRDIFTVGGGAAALTTIALAGTPQAQQPPPLDLVPKRAANRHAMTEKVRAHVPRSPPVFGPRVVEYATLAIGKGEQGGDNAGPFVDWISQTPPSITPAWCGAFVSACWFFAAWSLQKTPPIQTWRYGADGGFDPELWVPNLAANAKRAGLFVDGKFGNVARVVPGSFLLVRSADKVQWSHTEIVERVEGEFVHAIGGNIGAKTSTTGLDWVARVRRSIYTCDYGIAN